MRNEVTFGYLKGIPPTRSGSIDAWDYECSEAIWYDRYYYYANDGLQNQYVLYGMDLRCGADRRPRPEHLADETVALSGLGFSQDGNFMSYGVSKAGSDWKSWKIRDLRTGKDLPESIEWSKFSGTAWRPDGSGFFYSRYEAPKDGDGLIEINENQELWYHAPGTGQDKDVLVHRDPANPTWGFSPSVSEDGRYLIISTWRGGEPNMVSYVDPEGRGTVVHHRQLRQRLVLRWQRG